MDKPSPQDEVLESVARRVGASMDVIEESSATTHQSMVNFRGEMESALLAQCKTIEAHGLTVKALEKLVEAHGERLDIYQRSAAEAHDDALQAHDDAKKLAEVIKGGQQALLAALVNLTAIVANQKIG